MIKFGVEIGKEGEERSFYREKDFSRSKIVQREIEWGVKSCGGGKYTQVSWCEHWGVFHNERRAGVTK